MPRKKRKSFSRAKEPDLKYGDPLVTRLIGRLMWRGKRGVAEKIVYQALASLKEKRGEDPLPVFKKAMENIKPQMEVRSRRVGGANYQIPMEVHPERKLSLGLRWLVDSSRGRGEKTMAGRLAMEILEALENKGGAVRKKEETHRMAEANRAFAHYRW